MIIAVDEITDSFGRQRTIVTQRCDGPDCNETVASNDPWFGQWGSMLGFIDNPSDPDEKAMSGNWCSLPCLKAWAATL